MLVTIVNILAIIVLVLYLTKRWGEAKWKRNLHDSLRGGTGINSNEKKSAIFPFLFKQLEILLRNLNTVEDAEDMQFCICHATKHQPVEFLACPARFERATYALEEFVATGMSIFFNDLDA